MKRFDGFEDEISFHSFFLLNLTPHDEVEPNLKKTHHRNGI